MLEHWIQPLEYPTFQKDYYGKDRIGCNLSSLKETQEKKQPRAVALIGVDPRWSKLIRRHLYQFTHRMTDVHLYDLGDMRKGDPDFMVGPIVELLSSQICPVLLGSSMPVMKSLQQAFMHRRKPFRPAVVHECIPEMLEQSTYKSSIIGVQQHLVSKNFPQTLQTLHLSSARNAISDAETIIRDSNGIVFDMTAMSVADMPAQKSFSSSGFCTEEACMLMRFAGLHPETKFVMMTGHDPMSFHLDQSANTAAQLLWYFLESYNQCIAEDPLQSDHCTTYTVQLDIYDTAFKFFKSERTGRWWVQMLSETIEPVFPCTYKDYSTATNGLVSDRLIACANSSLENSK